MNENAAELTSIDCSKKKRKLQDSQLELPLAKQVCQEKVEGDKSAKGGESEQESANSNSVHGNYAESFMCSDDEDKTDCEFQEMGASDEPSTSSASWASLYSSSENRSSINWSAREAESLSMNANQVCPDDQYGGHVMGCRSDRHPEIQLYTDKELEELLYSDGVGPGGTGFILSSGRWSVGQGGEGKQEGKKKLTIDKEFEQFFSMLML